MQWETILELPTPFVAGDGSEYRVTVQGLQRPDGTWAGRLHFGGPSDVITEQETSQPTRETLEYWATGLEKVYLEGAFSRGNS